MPFINSISENIILPISDLITSQSIYKHLQFLNKSQFWTREQIDNYQNEKLRQLINHAYINVPFYRDLFSNLRLNPEEIKTKKDLEKLPIITKEDLKKNKNKLHARNIARNTLILSSSSGSTGEPLFYPNTKEAYSMNLAANLRGWYWMGYKLGDKYVKLSQNARKNPFKRLQDKMSRNLYLASNPLIDSNFDYILKQIEKYKPKVIRCYPDPLSFLAHYKHAHAEFKYEPLAINTTGNTLHPEARKEIETAFGCKIFDSYRCEGNSTIFECPTHTCYHSTEEYGISEVIDEQGNPIKSGVGRLISTDLWNLAQPFIRYDTQDYVEIDNNPCICGRTHLRINRILGRNNDILEISTGRKFIVHNFTGFFQVDSPHINRSVDQFQVFQKKDGTVIFRLIVNDKFNQTVATYIKTYWESELKTSVIIEEVEQIPLLSSGKRRFIIKEQ